MAQKKLAKIEVTPTKPTRSKGILMGLAVMPLGLIPIVREFIQSNPEVQPLIGGLLMWLVRVVTKAPLTINK